MNTFQKLCCAYVDRAKVLKLKKGKAFESECFSFFVGASYALSLADHPDAEHVHNCTAMILSVRGYDEVKRVAEKALEDERAEQSSDRRQQEQMDLAADQPEREEIKEQADD